MSLDTKKDLSISILDMYGKVVYSSLFKNTESINEQIDLTSFSDGVYFVSITGEAIQANEKIVIQK
jgi:hypothetical protein